MKVKLLIIVPMMPLAPPQIKGKIEHFISRRAMNIDGLGPETVDQFYQEGLIRDVADLYTLKTSDIINLERMGRKICREYNKRYRAVQRSAVRKGTLCIGHPFCG